VAREVEVVPNPDQESLSLFFLKKGKRTHHSAQCGWGGVKRRKDKVATGKEGRVRKTQERGKEERGGKKRKVGHLFRQQL